jgi:PKHD-type hydroxylase
LLSAARVAALRRDLQAEEEAWRPGEETAGWHARSVKSNLQLDRSSGLHRRLAETIRADLLAHPLLQARDTAAMSTTPS